MACPLCRADIDVEEPVPKDSACAEELRAKYPEEVARREVVQMEEVAPTGAGIGEEVEDERAGSHYTNTQFLNL